MGGFTFHAPIGALVLSIKGPKRGIPNWGITFMKFAHMYYLLIIIVVYEIIASHLKFENS